MNILKRFLSGRRDLINSSDPIRAFAVNPDKAFHQLHGDEGNVKARALLLHSVEFQPLAGGSPRPLASLASGLLLFVVSWEPYCAESIGGLFGRRKRDPAIRIAIVFLDDEPLPGFADSKRSSWYFPDAYVPIAGSRALTSAIQRVPWLVELDASMNIVREIEGRTVTP